MSVIRRSVGASVKLEQDAIISATPSCTRPASGMSIEAARGSGKRLVLRAILGVVTEGGYRGDLEAAQARIAQLEEELREARDVSSPALAEAEARHEAIVARVKKGRGPAAFLPAIAAVLAMLPVCIIAATHGDGVTAAVFAAFALSLGFGLSWLVRWLSRKQGAITIQTSASKLAEARRLARLEAQVRELKKEESHVRVEAPEAPPAEEEIVPLEEQELRGERR